MERSLPLIPVSPPLLPKCVEKISLNALAQDAMDSGLLSEGNYCILAYSKEQSGADLHESTATKAHFHHIGVFAEVVQFEEKSDFEVLALMETHGRVFIADIQHSEDGVIARCSPAQNIPLPKSLYQKAQKVRDLFQERMTVSGQIEDEIMSAITAHDRPSDLADQIAAFLELPAQQRQLVLEELDVSKRLDLIIHLLNENIINASLSRNLDMVLEDKLNRERKETVLRSKLRAIQMELNEEAGDYTQEYEQRLADTKMPEDTRREIEKEISKLRVVQAGSMEAGSSQAYLDFALSLPWEHTAKKVKKTEIKRVQKLLNQRHYGLNSVKERILEYLAVKRMAKESTSNILCLAGPPGVGKTSIVQSVAEALERPFYRISLGGVRDEADLRGHRRTYVGALPGKIIAALHKSQVNNPVILLDEIDKMASGFRGDPASALLEILDPEQNHSFMDHFLQVPYDLSNVLFICTANNLPDIPAPLLNRLELIRINGYSTGEKIELATKYLIPKLIREYGMENLKLKFTAANMETLITRYTADVGLRELRRSIESLLRKIALRKVTKDPIPKTFDEVTLQEFLGVGIPKPSISKEPRAGRATALYTDAMVGNTLPIEALVYPGTGRDVATGNIDPLLGEIINTALSYIKKHQGDLKLPKNSFHTTDLHVHFHKTELLKKGEGWGLAIYAAILSALLDLKIPVNVAFAGQISLLGKVLPTNDLDLKLLSASQLGIHTVVVSKWNIEEMAITIPDSVTIIPIEDLSEMKTVLASFKS